MEQHLTDKLISGYLDELIADEEVRFVQQHVAQCQPCAERLTKFSLLDETVAEMDPLSVEDTVFRQVRSRVLREVVHEKRAARRVLTPWWFNIFSTRAIAYASVAIVLVSSVVFFTGDHPEKIGPRQEKKQVAKGPDLSVSTTQIASAAQQEFYRKATGFLASTAKKAYNSASDEAKTLRDGSQSVLAENFAQLSERSSVFLASAKITASDFTETVGDQGSRALQAAAKQALPQAGISAGATLIQLL